MDFENFVACTQTVLEVLCRYVWQHGEEKLIILFVNFKNFVVSFGPAEWAVEMFNCY